MIKVRIFALFNLGFACVNAYIFPNLLALFAVYLSVGTVVIAFYRQLVIFLEVDSEGSFLKRFRAYFIWPIVLYEWYVFETALAKLNGLGEQFEALPEHEQRSSPLRKELENCLKKIEPHEKKLKKYLRK